MFREEHNSWIHLLAAVIVVFFGFWLEISPGEWCFTVLAIALVFMAEMINTAVENLLDFFHPEQHPKVGKIKDLAAGTVMVTAFFAIIVGIIIYGPKLIDKLGH